MKNSILLCTLFFTVHFLSAQVTQVLIEPCLEGQPLRSELLSSYKPATVQWYSTARELMYTEIDNVNGTLSGIYSGHIIPMDPNSSAPISDAGALGINCEHSYPQSKGADVEPAKSDMHHLFPANATVNSARSNCPYDEIPDANTFAWYVDDQVEYSIPSSNINDYSERLGSFTCGSFEPRESVKGDVARAIFYFYTMYKLEADAADPLFFDGQKSVLLDWHYQDPVDLKEYNRTFDIAAHQDGKTNPFVVDSTLARRAYFEADAILTGVDCNQILALEVQNFEGEVMDDFAVLNWRIEAAAGLPVNIERSKNGVSFEQIGKTSASSFNDFFPFHGTNYYRLSFEHHGHISYSKIVELSFEAPFTFEVFPNPFSDYFVVNLNKNENGIVLELFDACGKVILSDRIPSANLVRKFDLSQVPSGVYYLKLNNGEGFDVLKLIK